MDDKRNLVCLEPVKLERPWTLATYAGIGATSLEEDAAEKTPREQIIDAVKASACVAAAAPAFRWA